MKGSIHSDQVCPVCGSRFKSQEPKGLFCPQHPEQRPTKFKVAFGKITRRFNNYPAALQFLTGLRFQEGSGVMDERDYQVKAKPLSFDRLADEWLDVKAKQIRPESLKPLRLAMQRASKVWGESNIKSIQYAHIEDLINGLEHLSAKSRKHTLDALKQLWQWVVDRHDMPPLKKWPKLGYVEMAFRDTVDLPTQESIIEDIRKNEPFRVWLCIKWLATYISIRPGEMRSLTEGQVDRGRGVLIIPHPKERRAKIIPLIPEDIELIRNLPLAFDQSIPFFRHETGEKMKGWPFGHDLLYRTWRRACNRLGVKGVSIYPGTKHSTAMGLRAALTPEQIKSITLHSTSAAFNRYFQTSGEALRDLQTVRGGLVAPDNGLTMENGVGCSSQVIEFSKK